VLVDGLDAEGCSVLRALEGGEGSIEAVRSWRAWGFADAARGGLHGILVRSRHWLERWLRMRELRYLHRLLLCAFWSLSCDLNVLCGHVD